MKTVRPSDIVALAGVIDPDAYAAGTVTTAWIDMSKFSEVIAVIAAGTLGASATLDAKLEQAQDSGGTGVKDIAGKAITQLTQAGTDDSDKQAVINLVADELDVTNGFKFARLSVTTAVATSDSGAMVLGMSERYGPAAAQDLTSVAEIV